MAKSKKGTILSAFNKTKNNSLRNCGINCILNSCKKIKKGSGVYFVYAKKPLKKDIKKPSNKLFSNNVILPSEKGIKKRINFYNNIGKNNKILYIGQGKLNTRITNVAKMINQEKNRHRGGYFLSYLKPQIDNLYVCWSYYKDNNTSRNKESQYLTQYINEKGVLPFANLSFGKIKKNNESSKKRKK